MGSPGIVLPLGFFRKTADLIKRIPVGGERFLPQVNLVLRFLVAKIDSNPAHSIRRLCRIFQYEPGYNHVSVAAVEAPRFLGPDDVRGW